MRFTVGSKITSIIQIRSTCLALLLVILAGAAMGSYAFDLGIRRWSHLDPDTWEILTPSTMGYASLLQDQKLILPRFILESYCGIALREEKAEGWEGIRQVDVKAAIQEDNCFHVVLKEENGRELSFRWSRTSNFPSLLSSRINDADILQTILAPSVIPSDPSSMSDLHHLSIEILDDRVHASVDGHKVGSLDIPDFNPIGIRFLNGFYTTSLLSIRLMGTGNGGNGLETLLVEESFSPKGHSILYRLLAGIGGTLLFLLLWILLSSILSTRLGLERARGKVLFAWLFAPFILLPAAFRPLNLKINAHYEWDPYRFLPYPDCLFIVLGVCLLAGLLLQGRIRGKASSGAGRSTPMVATGNSGRHKASSPLKLAMMSLITLALVFGGIEGFARLTSLWSRANIAFVEDDLYLFKYTDPNRLHRGKWPPVEKPPHTVRIICLGGSSTYGDGMENASLAYPARLEALLNTNRNDPRHEVINAGILGYTSFQGLLYFKSELLKYQTDLVTVSFGANDVNRQTYYSQRQLWDRLQKRPPWIAWLQGHLRNLRIYTGLRSLVHWIQGRWHLFLAGFRDASGQVPLVSLHEFAENLKSFVAMSREQDFRLLFILEAHSDVLFRDPSRWSLKPYYDVMRTISDKEGIPLVDTVSEVLYTGMRGSFSISCI